ncbi:YCF48-related protein [Piscinibacter sakaiensis]|nr:YCF48-related protein [Piscinibacter sakaiensis]
MVALCACGGGQETAPGSPTGDAPVQAPSAGPVPAPPAQPAATALPADLAVKAPAHVAEGVPLQVSSNFAGGQAGLKAAWDFGDGSTADTVQAPSRVYARAGRYEVKLTITNEAGRSVTAAAQVLVGKLAALEGVVACAGVNGSGWCQASAEVSDVSFVDASLGWASDARGRVLQTQDGGRSWAIEAPVASRSARVRFASASTGWALEPSEATRSPRIRRTTDGGRTWVDQTPPSFTGRSDLRELRVIDAARAIVGTPWPSAPAGVLSGGLVTRDGGSSWSPLDLAVAHVTRGGTLYALDGGSLLRSTDLGATVSRIQLTSSGRVDRVDFADELNGLAFAAATSAGGAAVVWRTQDGGASWSRIEPQGLTTGSDGCAAEASTFLAHASPEVAWLYRGTGPGVQAGCAMRSADGGRTWVEASLPGGVKSSVAPRALSGQVVWWQGYLSVDAGASWLAGPPGSRAEDILTARASDSTIMVGSAGGPWWRTSDAGRSWQAALAAPIRSSQSGPTTDASPQTAWPLDRSRWFVTSTNGSLYRTTDAGATWSPVSIDPVTPPGVTRSPRLQFTSPASGWYLRQGGVTLEHSMDGGTSWRKLSIPRANDVHFLDDRQGILALAAPGVSLTADGGETWSPSIALPFVPYAVRWVTRDVVVATGAAGGIARSTDGGRTWTAQASGTDKALTRLVSAGATHGWAIAVAEPFVSNPLDQAAPRFVLRTTDGGATWLKTDLPTQAVLNDLVFLDARNGYIVAAGGVVLATTDGGVSWTVQATGTTEDLTTALAFEPGIAALVTRSGSVLKTVTGGY